LFPDNCVSPQLYTWGHGSNGRLGVGDTERHGVPEAQRAYFPVPLLLKSLEPIRQISCGADHTLAAGAAGVWAWGNGSGGKLGLGDNGDRLEPCLIPALRAKSVIQVAAGYWHSMAGTGARRGGIVTLLLFLLAVSPN
jgi:alpha-tubulin suppressor-like RCC1 family protein